MTKLDRLIAKLCPNGVEYRTIEEIVDLTMGTSPSGNTISEIPEGIEFHQGKSYFGNMFLQHSGVYTIAPMKIAAPGSVIMSVRAPVGDSNITEREIAIGRGLCAMKGKVGLDTKFLYYLVNANIQMFKNKSNGSTFESINTNDIKEIAVPLPPLPIQQEIVRILDKFTVLEAELETELETELEARKKQYEYYRNELLTFGNDVKWARLNEAGIMKRGTYVTKKNTVQGDIPVILGGQEPAYYCDTCNHDGEAIVMSRSGAYAGFVSFWNQPIFVTDGFIIETKDEIKMKYLYYYLKNMQDALHQMKRGGGVPHVRGNEIMEIKIPLPSLEEQARIVAILDRFDALTNDITSGLPAEIAARRKQYECYRDKLLTFPAHPAGGKEIA